MGRRSRWEEAAQKSRFLQPACRSWVFSRAMHKNPVLRKMGNGYLSHPVSPAPPSALQASQLGVYRAFVDNYGVAMETAEKCCQANAQFAEISEVIKSTAP